MQMETKLSMIMRVTRGGMLHNCRLGQSSATIQRIARRTTLLRKDGGIDDRLSLSPPPAPCVFELAAATAVPLNTTIVPDVDGTSDATSRPSEKSRGHVLVGAGTITRSHAKFTSPA